MPLKLLVKTMGCKVNTYESEAIMEVFKNRGYDVLQTDEAAEKADIFVINTCTVTHIADRKSRQIIRRFRRNNPDALVVVTGCYAQIAPDEVLAVDGVDLVLGNAEKNKLPDIVEKAIKDDCNVKGINVSDISTISCFDESFSISEMNDRARAFVKIEEGCNRFCSYCIIPYARGPVRSRNRTAILNEVQRLVCAGYKEIVLTGINTALYGCDNQSELGKGALCQLLASIEDLPGDFRVRLSSLEPTVINADFIKDLFPFERLCHHIHLSLQSGSDAVLQNMRRCYKSEEYIKIVDAIREFDPLYGITTDIIVGFPGETDRDFHYTVDMVQKCRFSKVHIFKYSDRKGTIAADFRDKVAADIKEKRSLELEAVSNEVANEFAALNVNADTQLLIEEVFPAEEKLIAAGYSDNYLRTGFEIMPEFRGCTAVGDLVKVHICAADGTNLISGDPQKDRRIFERTRR